MMQRYDSKVLHVRPDLHQRVKLFCKRNGVSLQLYVTKALKRQVVEDEKREREKWRRARLRDEREREMFTREVIAGEPPADSVVSQPPFWARGKT